MELRRLSTVMVTELRRLSTVMVTELRRLSMMMEHQLRRLSTGMVTERRRLSTVMVTELRRLSTGMVTELRRLNMGIIVALFLALAMAQLASRCLATLTIMRASISRPTHQIMVTPTDSNMKSSTTAQAMDMTRTGTIILILTGLLTSELM